MKKVLSFMIAVVLVISVFALTAVSSFAATSSSGAGIVSTASGALNVRSGASTSAGVLTALPKGSYVTLLSKTGDWWQVEYGAGKTGYCSAAYIQKVGGSYAAYVNTASGALNVRTGAGTSFGVKGTLAKNTTVVVLSQSGGWSRILYAGTAVGYVSSAYLKTYAAATTYPAISLKVPSYKQTDSRWAKYPIGTTGGTISTIGCATTALAMMESYRTGSSVTPPVMASRLSYSAGGSVYWPGNYSFNFTNSYSAIYNALKAGKPVLYGAQNAAGGQHWVVITGYTGGSTLSASGFTILDPGSNTRTNMQQFLNVYPNFYKYAVYA